MLGAETLGFSAPFGASALAGAAVEQPEAQQDCLPCNKCVLPQLLPQDVLQLVAQEEPHELPRSLPPNKPPRHPASAELTPKATAKTKTERYFILHSLKRK